MTRLGSLPAFDRMFDEPIGAGIALICGSGGTGKTQLLDDVARRFEDDGRATTFVVASSFGSDTVLPADVDTDVLLVDDAHLLSQLDAEKLVQWAEDRDRSFNICVTMRPVRGEAVHGRLVEVVDRRGTYIELGPFDENELGTVLSSYVDGAIDIGLFEKVQELTASQPLFVDRLVSGWVDAGNVERGRLVGEPAEAPPPLERAIAGPVAQLDESNRGLLAALSMQSTVSGIIDECLELDMSELVAHGLVTQSQTVPRGVAVAALRLLAPGDISRGEWLLSHHLMKHGADELEIAERLFTHSAGSETAAAAYCAVGDRLIDEDPAAAATWFGRALDIDDAIATRAKYAVALAASNDDLQASQNIATVLRSQPDEPRVLGASAQLAIRNGRWSEVEGLLASIDVHPRWSKDFVQTTRSVAAVIEGKASEDDASVSPADPQAATLEHAMLALKRSLEHTPDINALAEAVRALATRAGSSPPNPDLPINAFELGAVAALAAAEMDVAELLLASSHTDVPDASSAALHRWLRVRLGEIPAVPTSDTDAESPYVAMLTLAAEAAIARRAGDAAAGVDVLERLKMVVALAPIDVLTLDAAGELFILAKRSGSRTTAATLEDRIERCLRELGQPPLWVARRVWTQLEAAIATRDLEAAQEASKSLKAVGLSGPRITPLINASSIWVDVLAEKVEASAVIECADELCDAGHVWEAIHIAGQAAIRMEAPADAKTLLNYARELRSQSNLRKNDDGETQSGLSEREIEVGELLLDGHSYKEIGARLFISAKTVEHHASHIRRKLDATGVPRAAFIAALRTDLGR